MRLRLAEDGGLGVTSLLKCSVYDDITDTIFM